MLQIIPISKKLKTETGLRAFVDLTLPESNCGPKPQPVVSSDTKDERSFLLIKSRNGQQNRLIPGQVTLKELTSNAHYLKVGKSWITAHSPQANLEEFISRQHLSPRGTLKADLAQTILEFVNSGPKGWDEHEEKRRKTLEAAKMRAQMAAEKRRQREEEAEMRAQMEAEKRRQREEQERIEAERRLQERKEQEEKDRIERERVSKIKERAQTAVTLAIARIMTTPGAESK